MVTREKVCVQQAPCPAPTRQCVYDVMPGQVGATTMVTREKVCVEQPACCPQPMQYNAVVNRNAYC
jgi:hypothetical protein